MFTVIFYWPYLFLGFETINKRLEQSDDEDDESLFRL